MSGAAARDWHGVRRAYLRDDGAEAASLFSLVRRPLALDPRGVRAAWGRADESLRTVLPGVVRRPCAEAAGDPAASFGDALERDVARLARGAAAPALALGGGLDAAVVLAAWRGSGAPLPTVLTLETGLPGYDEVDEARALAAAVGARCEVVRVAPATLAELLPEAVRACEAPVYDLHPVGRLALARAARARGHRTLVTGDGADAAFAGRPDHDYVPLVAALTEAGGLALASPFLCEDGGAPSPTLAAALGRGVDRQKAPLRAYARAAGLPEALWARPKRPRLCPETDLGPGLAWLTRSIAGRPSPLARAAGALGLRVAPRLDGHRARVRWLSLALLTRALEEAA